MTHNFPIESFSNYFIIVLYLHFIILYYKCYATNYKLELIRTKLWRKVAVTSGSDKTAAATFFLSTNSNTLSFSIFAPHLHFPSLQFVVPLLLVFHCRLHHGKGVNQ